MRNIFYTAVLLLLFVLAGLFVKVNCDFEEYKKQVAIENVKNEERLAEMEKDIRILKTDSHISKHGFEGGIE